jgi:hypothetical protein
MSEKPQPSKRDLSDFDSDFGIFYPVGYLVVGFPTVDDAQKVQRDLITGGYEPADCMLYTSDEMREAAERNLREHKGFLARLGSSDEAVQAYLDAAKQGAAFLLIHAPDDLSAARAMNVIRRAPFKFAHRYHRLAIEELK